MARSPNSSSELGSVMYKVCVFRFSSKNCSAGISFEALIFALGAAVLSIVPRMIKIDSSSRSVSAVLNSDGKITASHDPDQCHSWFCHGIQQGISFSG